MHKHISLYCRSARSCKNTYMYGLYILLYCLIVTVIWCHCRFSPTVRQFPSPISREDSLLSDVLSDSRSPLLNTGTEQDGVRVHKKQKTPSLLRALLRVVGLKLLQSHLCQLFANVLIFCGPLLQRLASSLRAVIFCSSLI